MSAPALDAAEVLVGLNNGAGLYVAPIGTAPPADLTAAWPAGWVPIGYVSDDGVTLGSATESDTLTPWQSVSPVRTIITGKELTLHFIMWQTNAQSMGIYFDLEPGAGTGGVLSFDIRSDGGGTLYMIGLDIKDGDVSFRVVFGRAQLKETGDVQFSRGSAIGWEATLSALDDNGVLASVLLSDDSVVAADEDLTLVKADDEAAA